MLQHHRAGPDHADRIGDAHPGDIRRRAVHRFEHRRKIAGRIDVAGRRDADRAGAGGTQIRQNIAEQVGADHDVELVGIQHEMCGENIDVELVPAHVRIGLGHLLHALVPIRHGDRDAVGLGRRGEMLLRPRLREVEGIFQDAIDADARHHRLLGDEFAVGAGEHATADRRIFAFGVFTHDPEIDIAGIATDQRARHARHQAHRTQIDVLVELATELDQRAPQRDVIRNLGRQADGAEIDRVMRADLVLPVVRHHLAVLGVIIVGREVVMIEMQLDAVRLGGGFQHAQALGHHFLADAVAGDDSDAVFFLGAHFGFLRVRKTEGSCGPNRPRDQRCSAMLTAFAAPA